VTTQGVTIKKTLAWRQDSEESACFQRNKLSQATNNRRSGTD